MTKGISLNCAKIRKKFTELMNRKVPTRMSTTIGIVAYFSFGVSVVMWLNAIMQPEFVLTWLFPNLFLQIIVRLIPSILLVLVPAYLLWKWSKGIRSTWFFLGASLTSLFYAGQSLVQIAILYYINVGWALPDIVIEGYAFPAIYTFKLFRSIFLATVFSILGYWVEILKRK